MPGQCSTSTLCGRTVNPLIPPWPLPDKPVPLGLRVISSPASIPFPSPYTTTVNIRAIALGWQLGLARTIFVGRSTNETIFGVFFHLPTRNQNTEGIYGRAIQTHRRQRGLLGARRTPPAERFIPFTTTFLHPFFAPFLFRSHSFPALCSTGLQDTFNPQHIKALHCLYF
ncbi:hypothetical protein N657DRAFT_237358 [Parathielavia appendiculata]|uniref:Uncharacterized protein n=1 Tax=Parathielavia appendiculata TaxID=2587402 RepID=A0AAN6U7N9_9PEZI|nr:hypothetical protein N657DRAFT_237358 [Parathielavia appendiculata]